MESQSAAIRASELTKRFGDLTAVDHVSFEVRRGELFGLLLCDPLFPLGQ